MHLEIITPEKRLFEGSVKIIRVPGINGPFAILDNHAPIISLLEAGKIKVDKTDGNTDIFQIKSGIIEVKNNKIIILADEL